MNGDFLGIQVCVISWMNFNYKETGRKKTFPTSPNHYYLVSQYGEHDCCANNNKNRDYYAHPILSHFIDEF